MRWGGNQSAQAAAPAGSHHPWPWTSGWWLLGIVVTWICGLGWAWCLRRLPLGTAVPLYAGLVYVLSVLGGVYFLRERMSPPQVAGIVAIFVGLILVTLSSIAPSGHVQRQ